MTSGRHRPCPVCGRDVDGDCRWKEGEIIWCHIGTRFAPPSDLRIGDTLSLDGREWALVRKDGSYDRSAFTFIPHRPRGRKRFIHYGSVPLGQLFPSNDPVALAVDEEMSGLLEDIEACLRTPDFGLLLHPERVAAFRLIEETSEAVKAFRETFYKLCRKHPRLRSRRGLFDRAVAALLRLQTRVHDYLAATYGPD